MSLHVYPMEGDAPSIAEYSSSIDSSIGDSVTSIGSASSSFESCEDDDASSLHGPLYDLTELIAQLPVKRGLSKFYQGKSQSHTSLASVASLEDLAKKGPAKIKSCKSYAGLNVHKIFGPKATIAKKTTKSSSRRGESQVRVCSK